MDLTDPALTFADGAPRNWQVVGCLQRTCLSVLVLVALLFRMSHVGLSTVEHVKVLSVVGHARAQWRY
jgi:hypothetical protein